MHIDEKRILTRWQYKNRGNRRLTHAIDKLIKDLEEIEVATHKSLSDRRKDMDQVHNEGVYFFNIEIDRVMLMIKFHENRAIVLWIGNHADYERKFKNNKTTIEKWLRLKKHIK